MGGQKLSPEWVMPMISGVTKILALFCLTGQLHQCLGFQSYYLTMQLNSTPHRSYGAPPPFIPSIVSSVLPHQMYLTSCDHSFDSVLSDLQIDANYWVAEIPKVILLASAASHAVRIRCLYGRQFQRPILERSSDRPGQSGITHSVRNAW